MIRAGRISVQARRAAYKASPAQPAGDTTTTTFATRALGPCPTLNVRHSAVAPPPRPGYYTTRLMIAANVKGIHIAAGQPTVWQGPASAGTQAGTQVPAAAAVNSSTSFFNPQPCAPRPLPNDTPTPRPQTTLNGVNTVVVAVDDDVGRPQGYVHRHLLQDIHDAAATTPVHNRTIVQPIGDFTTAKDMNGTTVTSGSRRYNSNITPPIGALTHTFLAVHGGNVTSAEKLPAISKFPPVQCTAAAVVAGTCLYHECTCAVPDAAWPMPGCVQVDSTTPSVTTTHAPRPPTPKPKLTYTH